MKALLCVLGCIMLASTGYGQSSLVTLMERGMVKAASEYFAANTNDDGTGFNIINPDEEFTPLSLFQLQYGKDASTARFVAALIDLFSFPSSNSTFSKIVQFCINGNFQNARLQFSALIARTMADFVNEDGIVEQENEDEVSAFVNSLFLSLYDNIGDDRFASFLNLQLGSSLSFVMDTTGSMAGEIEAAKERVAEIIRATRGTNSEPLEYLLMPYNDPGYGPLTKTNDPDVFTEALAALTASGGGDEPELAVTGMRVAAQNSAFRSIVYVFTDATAGDIELQNQVIALCLIKKVSVYIFLTKNISRKKRDLLERRALYEHIADQTGGGVIQVDKDEITAATAVMQATTIQGLVTLQSISKTKAASITFNVDPTIEYVLLQINGNFGAIDDSQGVQTIPGANVETLASTSELRLYRYDNLSPLPFTFSLVGDDLDYGVLVRAKSNLGFHAILSQKKNGEYAASRQLMAYQMTIADMWVYGDSENVEFTNLQLIDRSENILVDLPLIQRASNEYTVATAFKLPGRPMFVRMMGKYQREDLLYPIERVDPCAITPTVSNSTLSQINDQIVEAGTTIQVKTTFTNREADDNIILQISDDKDFAEIFGSNKFSLNAGEQIDITITITVPAGTVEGVLSSVLITATGVSENYYVFETFIVTVIDDVVRCPSLITPAGGTLTCTFDGRSIDSECVLTCSPEHVLEGAGSIMCGPDGNWNSESVGSCKLLGSETCHLNGDPHYKTFDGKFYDFMGTCLYNLVETIPGVDVERVIVSTENTEQHVRRRVSWMKQAFVTVYNYTIHFKYGQVVLVNGVRRNLPIFLHASRIRIKRDGRDVMLTTDFKMTVRYDGQHNFRISLPASYIGKVTGLCGNYDGDEANDFAFGNTTFTDPALFGNAYELIGSPKPGCRKGQLGDDGDRCATAAQRALFAEKCAAIKSECFSGCADEDELETKFVECVFDMCATQGEREAVENAIAAFADLCSSDRNIAICDWRDEFDYPINCERNAIYDANANRCPNTCVDLNAEARCRSKPRTGACVCVQGFVRDGDECVRIADCGCSVSGQYYRQGQLFISQDCTESCQCMNGKITCTEMACDSDRECRLLPSGKYGCQLKQVDICSATGDPHYKTFDGSRYDFMGVCSYVMMSTVGITDPEREIVITAQNEHRNGNTRVSYIRLVNIKYSGTEIQLGPGKSISVAQNGTLIDLPDTVIVSDMFSTSIVGRFVKFFTSQGIKVEFDGMNLYIHAPSFYMDKVVGLCGNYTGVTDDDFGGRTLKDFANSYIVSDGCAEDPDLEDFVCSDADKTKWGGPQYCGRLKEPNSPLRYCYDLVDVQPFFDDCVFDVCATEDENLIQNALDAYQQACRNMDIELPCDWEEKLNFTLPFCPENSRYDSCASQCHDTCENPTASQKCEETETVRRCVCKPGYLLHNDECVEESSCGCVFEVDGYVEQGATYMTDECKFFDTCVGAGNIKRINDPCGEDATCKKSDSGEYQCIPDEFAYCLMYGKIHFKTFDNNFFNFPGNCGYLLAGFGDRETDDPDAFGFAVHILNGGWELNNGIAVSVEVWRGKKQYEVKISAERIVMVEDIRVAIGSKLDELSVEERGGNIALLFEFGLQVHFNTKDWVRVDVESKYQNGMYGMGGNYDGESSNDMLVEGDIMLTPTQWGDLWRVDEQSCSRCIKKTEEIDRTCLFKARYERTCDCGVITDTTGPFSVCHAKMDPQPFFQSCVLTACKYEGNPVAIAKIAKAYSIACLGKGIKVGKWRDTIRTPKECPENTHFDDCASQCQPRCGAEKPTCSTTCTESCVCNDGYILSDDICVPEEKCGCKYEGRYFKHGESRTDSDCSQKCSCIFNEWSCEDTRCNDAQYCGTFKGVVGCHWKDKCKYDNGGCSDTCKSMDNKAYCDCLPHRILTWDDKTCIDISPVFFGKNLDRCDTEFNIWKNEFNKWQNEILPPWMEELKAYREYIKTGIISNDMDVCRYEWTEWFDRDDPGGMGDEESLEILLIEEPGKICNKPIAAEGRLADGRALSAVSANVKVGKDGLTCMNADQEKGKQCPDFAVRFLCFAVGEIEQPRCDL